MDLSTGTGRVERVNGPVVHLGGLGDVTRFEYVEVGHDRLPGEIIALDLDRVVAQLYEYTGGLEVGEPAWTSGHPLTVELGPGLLGGIYDGLLRPLDEAPDFLPPRGLTRAAASTHEFVPSAVAGTEVRSGDVLGSVTSTTAFDHLVVVPPGVGGSLDHLVTAGRYDTTATIAIVGGTPIALTGQWPSANLVPTSVV